MLAHEGAVGGSGVFGRSLFVGVLNESFILFVMASGGGGGGIFILVMGGGGGGIPSVTLLGGGGGGGGAGAEGMALSGLGERGAPGVHGVNGPPARDGLRPVALALMSPRQWGQVNF